MKNDLDNSSKIARKICCIEKPTAEKIPQNRILHFFYFSPFRICIDQFVSAKQIHIKTHSMPCPECYSNFAQSCSIISSLSNSFCVAHTAAPQYIPKTIFAIVPSHGNYRVGVTLEMCGIFRLLEKFQNSKLNLCKTKIVHNGLTL